VITVRFFAAAREAVGASTVSVASGTLGSVLDAFDQPVIARCSYLVNGISEKDRSRLVVEGDTVDVLPPFAGG
jgi:molybdopterin synthase sulfur carrier subunit